jgi:antitoxin component YwqK of YwqJK toxin-antitoxin module
MGKVEVIDEDEIEPSDDDLGDYLYRGRLVTGISCEKDRKTGAVIGVTGYRDGALHGADRTWYENGQLAEEEFFRDGQHHGPQHEWYRDGRLKRAGYVDRGVTVWMRTWYDKGELTSSVEAVQNPELLASLEEARKSRATCTVIDIDVDTWEFVERPDGWRIDERP